MTDIDDFPIVTEPSTDQLSEKQLTDYRAERESFIEWLCYFGKEPEAPEGYSDATVLNSAYRTDKFYRWVWDKEDRYTLSLTPDHADEYLRMISMEDSSDANKHTIQLSIQRLYKWYHLERGGDEWEPDYTFSGSSASKARDYFTRDERTTLREVALEYGSIPGYNDLDPEERDSWRRYLSKRFEKPLDEIGPEDWDRANGWKYTSIVWTSLDAGLRPIEVERARVGWVDTDNSILRIPASESSKGEEYWRVSLRDRTADALERWLEERQVYDKYQDTDRLWLTREGNPYTDSSLRYLLQRLCEEGGIDQDGRTIGWYTIRHSVGTYMTREEDLAATQAQLRHKSPKTTMKYDNAPPEARRDALDKMG